jgi:hypothetical protein
MKKLIMILSLCAAGPTTCHAQTISIDSLKSLLKGEWSLDASPPHRIAFDVDSSGKISGKEGTLKIAEQLWIRFTITKLCSKEAKDELGTGYYMVFNHKLRGPTYVSIRSISKDSLTLPPDKWGRNLYKKLK